MKRILITLAALCLLFAPLAAQSSPLSGFSFKDASAMAMGGTFTAVSEGFRSLYGNPTGFAAEDGELTILAPTVWAYFRPTEENIELLKRASGEGDDALNAVDSLLTDNGLGAGANLGLGYVGGGLGIGLFVTGDAYASGQTLAGAVADTDVQVNLVLGLALPVNLFGLKLTVGGDLRPFYRMVGDFPLSEVLGPMMGSGEFSDILTSNDMITGFGVAMDLGASLELGAFEFGLVVRDLAPSFRMYGNTIQELVDSGFVVSSGDDKGLYSLTPCVVAGVQYHPKLDKLSWLDPRVIVELRDPVSVIRDKESVFNLIHAGAEIKMFDVLALRGGVNEGWLSAGVGLDLFVLEINAAVFTEELGWRPGQNGRSGVSLEVAIRI